jgi:hypothetical protein
LITIPKRLPHIVTRADWVTLLTSTYGEAQSVDDEEAAERLTRALGNPALLDELYEALAVALEAKHGGPPDDKVLDRFSKAIQKRRGRVRAAAATTELSALLVHIDLEIGVAPEVLRPTLTSEKGAKLLAAGRAALANHLVKELLK